MIAVSLKQPKCITNFCYACDNQQCKNTNQWLYKRTDKCKYPCQTGCEFKTGDICGYVGGKCQWKEETA